MMQVSRVIVALFITGAACGAPSAQDTLQKIRDTGTITLGHRDNFMPFSYYDDNHQFVGYSIDICHRIVDTIQAVLKIKKIDIKRNPTTLATSASLLANGIVDLNCGPAINNTKAQEHVAFSLTYFVATTRFISRKSASIRTVEDLKGKSVASTSGTPSLKQALELNELRKMGMAISAEKGHAQAFQAVATGRAAAFFMDDVTLHLLAAGSQSPQEWIISSEAFSAEPYALTLRREDREFKKLVDGALLRLFNSGEINNIYDKWFLRPVPTGKGGTMNLALRMNDPLKRVLANPTDSGDPRNYN